ncbi:MAG: TIGR02391 family protein [Bacillota bacterium]
MKMNEQHIRNLSKILADNNTHREINQYLLQSNIENKGVDAVSNGYGYTTGTNKETKLFNSFVNSINTSKSDLNIYKYIEQVANPVNYISEPSKHKKLVEDISSILLFVGKRICDDGKIVLAAAASTISDVQKRVDSLNRELYNRKIHPDVTKWCTEDCLRKDYYNIVFEATKGVAERVRDMTGLTTDGYALFNDAFSTKDPYLIMNRLATSSECNEHNGVKLLMQSVVSLVRNPMAHTPKMNWHIEEDKALDILSVLSLIHKYLDIFYKHPNH